MGSKSAMVIFVEAGLNAPFRGASEIDHLRSQRLAEKVLGVASSEVGALPLDLAAWPDVGTVCAASLPGSEVVCSAQFARHRPSELTEWILGSADGKDAYAVFMHSAEDWSAFAVWSDGQLLRSLSINPEFGTIEDVGERLPFEIPFWEGDFPVRQEVSYALPFHPIDLGNAALREFFGFILEGREDEACFDPEEVEIPQFTPLV